MAYYFRPPEEELKPAAVIVYSDSGLNANESNFPQSFKKTQWGECGETKLGIFILKLTVLEGNTILLTWWRKS